MSASQTSPAIIVLIIGAAVVTLLAWWLSVRNSRRTRTLITYLQQNQTEYWHSLPWLLRHVHVVGAVEAYRRSSGTADAEFLARYQLVKRGSRFLLIAIAVAMAMIGLVIMGTTFWAWRW